MVRPYVSIPEYITVHLGPPDSDAENVTVPFIDYIKNVASSEIYPTWPENSLRANMYAQITFVLNRIFTEWYRSRGYPFDITSSTSYDQKFIKNRNIFENISKLGDELFNKYVSKQGFQNPYYTEYCNGTTVTCPGLSQWGTVDLAEEGYTPYEILQYYYGNDIDIRSAPVLPYLDSYPGTPLQLGSSGFNVETIQKQLNRIGRNFPAIPIIYPEDGIFGPNTENAVKAFQRAFDLTPDGIVGSATWYRISFIYSSVKRLAELYGEGISLGDAPKQYTEPLKLGSSGRLVSVLQYHLSVIGSFYDEIAPVDITGNFGNETLEQVLNFQRLWGLEQDGIVGLQTWRALYAAYVGILETVPQQYYRDVISGFGSIQYPGYTLKQENGGIRF